MLPCASCASFLFLPHFDVICDLLLNRRTATWNLFVNSHLTILMYFNKLDTKQKLEIINSTVGVTYSGSKQ